MQLRQYLEIEGIKFNKFAEKIGMGDGSFRQVMSGRINLPVDYWKKVVEITNNKVTWDDLHEQYMSHKERKRKKSGKTRKDND